MSDIELRLVPLRDRGVSGGESACCATEASDEDATPSDPALDFDTGAMNIEEGRERPLPDSTLGAGAVEGGTGKRRELD